MQAGWQCPRSAHAGPDARSPGTVGARLLLLLLFNLTDHVRKVPEPRPVTLKRDEEKETLMKAFQGTRAAAEGKLV